MQSLDNQKKPSVTDAKDDLSNQSAIQSSETKKKQTTPTLNPDIEFVNRTLP